MIRMCAIQKGPRGTMVHDDSHVYHTHGHSTMKQYGTHTHIACQIDIYIQYHHNHINKQTTLILSVQFYFPINSRLFSFVLYPNSSNNNNPFLDLVVLSFTLHISAHIRSSHSAAAMEKDHAYWNRKRTSIQIIETFWPIGVDWDSSCGCCRYFVYEYSREKWY